MKKKLLALVCALALTVSLVGCALSTPDTVGKIGDFEVTSGLYLLAQYDAYQQAAQLADSEQDTSKVNSFLKATITTDADTGVAVDSPCLGSFFAFGAPMPTPARPPW